MAEILVGKNTQMLSIESPLVMAQSVPDRVIPENRSTKRFSTKQGSPNPKHKIGLTLLAILLTLLLLFFGMWVVAKNVQMLPDAAITINPSSLHPQQIMHLQQVLGKTAQGNFYRADLQDYKNRTEALPWVSQVDIKRDWQKGLVINVVPRQPVAKFGSEKLIDASGKVFTPVDGEQLNNQKWMQLQGDPEKSALIMQQTEQVTNWFYPLNMKVSEVILTPRMTWLFRFDNGLRVLVDKDGTSEKLYQLSILLQNQLKTKLSQIQTIDLRYKNGMALMLKSPTPSLPAISPNATTQALATTKKTG